MIDNNNIYIAYKDKHCQCEKFTFATKTAKQYLSEGIGAVVMVNWNWLEKAVFVIESPLHMFRSFCKKLEILH